MENSQNGIIPEAIGAVIETVFTCGKAEILAPGAGFAAAGIGRYLLGRLEQGRVIFISQLERAGATTQGLARRQAVWASDFLEM